MSAFKGVLLGCVLLVPAAAFAGECATPRQYYSHWQKSPSSEYAYRTYYYKPNTDYAGYKHHYVILKDDHCYYYNPYEKKVWGRCHAKHQGRPQYQILAPQDRRPTIGEIPESAFPVAGCSRRFRSRRTLRCWTCRRMISRPRCSRRSRVEPIVSLARLTATDRCGDRRGGRVHQPGRT